MTKTPDGFWRCLECGRTNRKKMNISVHVEAKHIETAGFVCPYDYCSFSTKTRDNLKRHISRIHRRTQWKM